VTGNDERRALTPELSAVLARGDTGPFPVVAIFASDHTEAELDALGLYSSGGPSTLGYGKLAPLDLSRLASHPDVRSIQLTDVLPHRASGEIASSRELEKVDPLVLDALSIAPNQVVGVVVAFAGTGDDAELERLGVCRTHDVGVGTVDLESLQQLAARQDVERIALAPEPHLS
jgi:hypothetical protein